MSLPKRSIKQTVHRSDQTAHHLQDSIHCNLHVTNGSQCLFSCDLDRSRLLHHRLGGLSLLLDFGKLDIGIVCNEDEFESYSIKRQ